MATRYVDGVAGNNANNGLAPVFDGVNGPKLTLNGAEDTPVAANDTIHVKAGVYRETLTVDVSGVAAQPITYIGDYAGAIWPGVGGVVRITGSDNDRTTARNNGILASAQRNYRTFRNFLVDTTAQQSIYFAAGGTNGIIENCMTETATGSVSVQVSGANQSDWTIRRCKFQASGAGGVAVNFAHAVTVSNTGHVVENCYTDGGYSGGFLIATRVGGITVRNCTVNNGTYGVWVSAALAAGQTVTVNNCIFAYMRFPLAATALGEIVEDYNTFYGNTTNRSNVGVGANSLTYPPLFDTRWFFEAVNGGRMVTPFDLGAWSQLINVAGTNPPATDLRGTGAIGGVREWGPLEYDTTLYIAGDDGCDYPLPGTVEAGTVYGSGTYTGTLVCPAGGGGARPGCRWPDYKRRFDT